MRVLCVGIMLALSSSAFSADVDASKLDISGIKLHMSCSDVERVASQQGLRISDRLGVREFRDIINNNSSGRGLKCPATIRGKNNERIILRWAALPKGVVLHRIRMLVPYSKKIFHSRVAQKYGEPTRKVYSGMFYGIRVKKSSENHSGISRKKPFLLIARDWLELTDKNIVIKSNRKVKAAQASRKKPINPVF